jgi:hypothetical protein
MDRPASDKNQGDKAQPSSTTVALGNAEASIIEEASIKAENSSNVQASQQSQAPDNKDRDFDPRYCYRLPGGRIAVRLPPWVTFEEAEAARQARVKEYWEERKLAEETARNTEFNKNIKCKASFLFVWQCLQAHANSRIA